MQTTFHQLLAEVHAAHAADHSGALADYIPELTRADPSHFGIVMVTADGHRYAVGDVDVPFTIQSVSKAFTYGMALDAAGPALVESRVGVEPSGEAFNSISLDPDTGRPRNPMINAGAIAVTGMIPDGPDVSRFERIRHDFSRLAGRELSWDESVWASERETGFRNRAIANLLRGFDLLDGDVDPIVDDYFRQCSVEVTCEDLAVMAGTLAAGGRNPLTDERVMTADSVDKVLSVMSTCGMYDYSGTWVYEVGLPAKSGVGGGVIGVLPGQLAIALFSPLLDANGNSVRGVAGFRELSRRLDLHVLRAPTMSRHAIRRQHRLSDVAASRWQPEEERALITDLGRRVEVLELQGDLFASSLERVLRAFDERDDEVEMMVIDLRRAVGVDRATVPLLRGLARDASTAGVRLLMTDPGEIVPDDELAAAGITMTATLDDALSICESLLMAQAGHPDPASKKVALEDFDLLEHLTEHERMRLTARFEEVRYGDGEVLVRQGDAADALYLLSQGTARITFTDAEEGRSHHVADRYPGVMIGEMSVIRSGIRTATVTAVGEVVCHRLLREQVADLRRTDHLIYTRLVEQLLVAVSGRLRRADAQLSLLG